MNGEGDLLAAALCPMCMKAAHFIQDYGIGGDYSDLVAEYCKKAPAPERCLELVQNFIDVAGRGGASEACAELTMCENH